MFSDKTASQLLRDVFVGGMLLGLGAFVSWVWTIDHTVSANELTVVKDFVSKDDFAVFQVDFKEFKTWLNGELREIKILIN